MDDHPYTDESFWWMSRGSVGRKTGGIATFGPTKVVPGRHSDWRFQLGCFFFEGNDMDDV